MNFKSLTTKISLLFLISIILFVAVFFAYLEYEKKQFDLSLKNKYNKIADLIHRNRIPPHDIGRFVNSFNLVDVEDPELLKFRGEIITQGRGFEILKYEGIFYFHFHTPHFKIMFKDLNNYKQSYLAFVIFGFLFILFLFIYILIIKNIKQTSLLLNSRQLFLRTVMHELKTPIAKGRIVSELIDDEKQKNRMIAVFEKLNFLINDFAKVEQVVSKNYSPNIHGFSIKSILQNSIESLMLDNTGNITLENITDKKLDVDLELFSMAVKNLLDNGLKYSLDKKIIVKQEDNQLLFISSGSKLPKPLIEYFKPFHNETKAKNHGMGLGLYIVRSILDIHKFSFEYEYKDDNNIFSIGF